MKPLPFCILASLLAYAVFSARASAQDITFSNPVIVPLDFPNAITADTPPIFKRAWKVSPPDVFKWSNYRFTNAHAFIIQYIDENGKLQNWQFVGPTGASRDFARFLQQSQTQPPLSPATLNGEPVSARIFFTAIFNPALASHTKANAIPRILAVAPVRITQQQQKDLLAAKESLSVSVRAF